MSARSDSVVTLNKHGRTSLRLNEVSAAFVEHSSKLEHPVLDVGCAMGVASHAALQRGAFVIALDIHSEHIEALIRATPSELRLRLTTVIGRFPYETEFAPNSLGAIHAANLLNFLTGEEIEIGLRKAFSWLVPGGRIFTISGTPYANNVRGFIQEFEKRQQRGEPWPGYVHKLSEYSSHHTLTELPTALHLLDPQTLESAFHEAGFRIDVADFFARDGVPDYVALDGRENVRVIATKVR